MGYTEAEIRTCDSLLQEPCPDYCKVAGRTCALIFPSNEYTCKVPHGEMEKIELRKQGFDV